MHLTLVLLPVVSILESLLPVFDSSGKVSPARLYLASLLLARCSSSVREALLSIFP